MKYPSVLVFLCLIFDISCNAQVFPVGIDSSVWNRYVQKAGGEHKYYLRRTEVVSQRDLMGKFPDVKFEPIGPERVYYRRILTPIYAKKDVDVPQEKPCSDQVLFACPGQLCCDQEVKNNVASISEKSGTDYQQGRATISTKLRVLRHSVHL